MKKEKRISNEMFVLLPDGTRSDAELHLPILEGVGELPPELLRRQRERLLRAGFTIEEIETRFDKR